MSSIPPNPGPTIPRPSSASDRPPSSSRPDTGDPPIHHPPGAGEPHAVAASLLHAVKDCRQIVRLIQCWVCSGILCEPITLPCGRSLCRQCMPSTHVRTNISWPGTSNRLRGFTCPFAECARDHALGDCGVDVTLNKVLGLIKTTLEQGAGALGPPDVSTRVVVQDPWAVAGLTRLEEKEDPSRVLNGGRIAATYTLANMGNLQYSGEVEYSVLNASDDEVAQVDVEVLNRLKEAVRSEMDCQVCYALYLEPYTTACGHTFCRMCLHRVLDHSEHCPICRRTLTIQPQLEPASFPSNHCLSQMINGFWADLVAVRAQTARLEQGIQGDCTTPIFVCTLSFPTMPTFLHVFEPRYRLMVRRAMEADRTFGMVLYAEPESSDGLGFHPIGTLLRIINIEFFPDGRSLLETVGVSRFRVRDHRLLDGYLVGKVEKIDDVSLAEEEVTEASETMRTRGRQDFTQRADGADSAVSGRPSSGPASHASLTRADIDGMATRELLEMGIRFVTRMRRQSVAWLASRVLAIYGEHPNDPALFPWWFASVLPVTEEEKYRLLGTSSVRARLKICCHWIVEWESSRW